MPRATRRSTGHEPFHYRQPLVGAVAAGALGIVADRHLVDFTLFAWWIAGWSAMLLWAVASFIHRDRIAIVPLLISIAALAAAWHHWSWNLFDKHELARAADFKNAPVCVEAVALSAPRRIDAPADDPMRPIPQGDQSRLDVRIVRVRNGNTWQPSAGRVPLLVEGHLLGVQAGDRVRIFGQLARPQPQQNPGEFDFAAHNRADRKLCLLRCNYPDCVAVVESGSAWNWRLWLDRLRSGAARVLQRRLGESQSPMASAILLGAREDVSREQTDAFFQTGTIHLFAISGLHVGILAGALFFTARCGLMPRRVALLFVIVLTVGYCLLTDARPPVVRATILVVTACLAWMSLRRPSLINTLSGAAIVVLILNPADLFRTGPQLSFLAVATLAFFQRYLVPGEPDDPLDRLIVRTRPGHVKFAKAVGLHLWKLFVVSAIIWLVALPLVMYRFHLFSPIALVLNTLIATPITLALLFGFGTLLAELLCPPLAGPMAAVCDTTLWLTQSAVNLGAQQENAYFYVAGPPLWWVLIFYTLLAAAFVLPRLRPPRRWCAAILLAWLAVGFVYPLLARGDVELVSREPELRCTFVSIGHGSAVVLELPDGRTLLYDGGQLGSPDSGAQSIAAYLWSRQITHLDAVVISHADVDHYNAIPGLLKRFSIGAVYVSPVMFEDDWGAVVLLRETIEEAGVPIRTISANDRLAAGDHVSIEVLHPTEDGVIGSDNANSVVLLVEFARRRILLPGDLESPGLDDVMAEQPQDVDVLMAPHHGSARSSPAGFAAWCTPEHVIISGGRSRDASAAIAAYEESGAVVRHTAETGAVTATLSKPTLEVAHWRQQ